MLDLSRSIRGLLSGAIQQARQAEDEGEWARAVVCWQEAARLSEQVAQSASSDQERAMRQRASIEFREQARKMEALEKSGVSKAAQIGSNKQASDELRSQIQAFQHRSNVGWDQVAGLDETVGMIQSAYALSLARPPHGVELRARHNLLFYGPPGCGKSLLAAAASHSLDATFFNVPVSGLLSKWFGESSRLIAALFAEARRHPASVLFLDEIDAIAGTRDTQDSNASRQILANLLTELDGVATKDLDNTLITIAATNAPWHLDEAVLSRFTRRVYIPLPDWAARRQMFEIHLIRCGFELEQSLDDMAAATEGYSGREIEQVCQALIERMIWKQNPELVSLAGQGRAALAAYTVSIRPIADADLQSVLGKHLPQTSPESMAKFTQWGQ